MALTPNVVDGAIIQASWGNQIRDRSNQIFATTAERDQQWAAPPDGAVCQAPVGTWWNRVAGVWVSMQGTLRQGTIPSGTVNPSAETMVATITLPAGLYRISYVNLLTSTAGLNCTFKLFNVGVLVFQYRVVTADVQGSHSFAVPVTVTTGGAVTVNLSNAGTQPAVCYPDPLFHSLSALQGHS